MPAVTHLSRLRPRPRFHLPCRARSTGLAALLALGLLGTACGSGEVIDPATVPQVEREVVDDPAVPVEEVPTAVTADGAVRLVDVATDNYKASFNEDPSVTELRTWLAIRAIEVEGVRYVLADPPPVGEAVFAEAMTLEQAADAVAGGSLPRQLDVSAHVIDGPGASIQLRAGPQDGRWGPLLVIAGRDELEQAPVMVELRLSPLDEPGADLSLPTVELAYAFDAGIAAAPASSLEHNGPGGRWQVAGQPTVTNLEEGWE